MVCFLSWKMRVTKMGKIFKNLMAGKRLMFLMYNELSQMAPPGQARCSLGAHLLGETLFLPCYFRLYLARCLSRASCTHTQSFGGDWTWRLCSALTCRRWSLVEGHGSLECDLDGFVSFPGSPFLWFLATTMLWADFPCRRPFYYAIPGLEVASYELKSLKVRRQTKLLLFKLWFSNFVSQQRGPEGTPRAALSDIAH